ncbi:MAG: radical SAM protein [Candidatus Thermoplasmatota archaeon]|nr:radical SAM protein [Candidatus Thermoplasmatota archaeon]
MKNKTDLSMIVLEYTYRCNSSCIFCYNCWKNDYDVVPELSVDEWKPIIHKLPPVKRITISGGEPLMRDDLPDLIDLLKERTKYVSVLTNGTLLDDRWARMFKEKEVFVQVPLHGLERNHDLLVGMTGGFRKAVKGIAYLNRNMVDFAVSVVGNKKNIGEIRKIFELAVALGASELLAIRFIPGGEGLRNLDLMMDAKEYETFLSEFDRVLNRYRLFGALGIPNIPCKFPEKGYKALYFSGCTAGVDWLALDPAGRVRVCNHSPTIIGDLREQTFGKVWNHPLLRAFRKHKVVPEECRGCDKVDTCLGGCRAAAQTLHGDWKAHDPLFDLR